MFNARGRNVLETTFYFFFLLVLRWNFPKFVHQNSFSKLAKNQLLIHMKKLLELFTLTEHLVSSVDVTDVSVRSTDDKHHGHPDWLESSAVSDNTCWHSCSVHLSDKTKTCLKCADPKNLVWSSQMHTGVLVTPVVTWRCASADSVCWWMLVGWMDFLVESTASDFGRQHGTDSISPNVWKKKSRKTGVASSSLEGAASSSGVKKPCSPSAPLDL